MWQAVSNLVVRKLKLPLNPVITLITAAMETQATFVKLQEGAIIMYSLLFDMDSHIREPHNRIKTIIKNSRKSALG